jgi:methionine-rich copper-binding protein CopC
MRLISRILAPVALSSLMACGSGGGGGGGGGGTAPTVVSTSPANGATSIAVSTGVTVTFSEAMDCSTITSASFFVELGGTLAPGTIACAGTTATLTPSPALSAGSTYTATVQAGVKSTTALALAQSVTWSFTTAASSVPPTVVSTVPASGATNVAISAGLTVTFSEAMDCTTITSTSFFEALGGTPTPGTIACGGSQATFTPSASLSLAATYTATVQAGVKSTNGLALAASVTWSFSTEAVVPSCGGDSGKIYVADFANDRVVRMDDMCGDNWTTLDDSNDGVLAELNEEGVSVDSAGKIYIADTFNNRIVRVDDMTGANPVTYSGLSTSLFSAPRTVVVDAAGHIYVTDGFDFPRIVRMDDMTGTGWTVYPPAGTLTSPFKGLWGLFVDSMNRIYVVDNDGSNYSVGRVVRMDDMTGANLVSFGTYGTGTNQFAFPWGVSVDSTFHIYVADASNSRIVRINDMTGAGWTTLGTLGTGVGQFYDPVGIFVDGTGHIYVADYGGSLGYGADDHIVRMDDMTGTNWTTLGSEGAEVKEFDGASSVWVH